MIRSESNGNVSSIPSLLYIVSVKSIQMFVSFHSLIFKVGNGEEHAKRHFLIQHIYINMYTYIYIYINLLQITSKISRFTVKADKYYCYVSLGVGALHC